MNTQNRQRNVAKVSLLSEVVRFRLVMALSASVMCCAGGSVSVTVVIVGPPIPDDATYVINSVTLTGPDHIAKGASANYLVSFTGTRTGSSGTIAPVVMLLDQDSGLRFGDDLLTWRQVRVGTAAGPFTGSTTMALSCDNDSNVFGDADVDPLNQPNDPNSGEGGKEAIFFDNPADMYAPVSRESGLGSGQGVSSDPMSSPNLEVHCD